MAMEALKKDDDDWRPTRFSSSHVIASVEGQTFDSVLSTESRRFRPWR